MGRPVYVVGSGTYLPGEPIPAERIGEVLGPLTAAPPRIRRWIESTGPVLRELLDIRWVHYAFDPSTRRFTDDNVSMSTAAARAALARAGVESADVDLICYGSAQLDQMPTTSVRIQEALGIEVCDELSIHANCTSAYKALYVAHRLIADGRNEVALVVSSGVSSSELIAEYYNQAKVDKESLFLRWFLCDGAGAVVLSAARPPGVLHAAFELEASYIESIGGKRPSLMWNERPARHESPLAAHEAAHHHLRQRFRNELGSGLFQEAGGSVFKKGLLRMIEREGIPVDRIRYLQVNMPTRHIVASVMDELEAVGIPRSALVTRLDELGYTGPPAALIGLDHVLREERFEGGDRAVSFVTEVSKFMQAGYSVKRVDSDG
jgi:3-oxoacyl-[acyl-carrier-protein] synthase III